MTKRLVSVGMLASAAFLVTVFSPRQAHAWRACTTAADCPGGFDCMTSATTDADGGAAGLCMSLPCTSDADCGTAMRCLFGTVCDPAADGGKSCLPKGMCTPQWQVPCSVDADCGPGFTCGAGPIAYECGLNPDADVVLAPYQTGMTVPCSDVPRPPWPQSDSGPLLDPAALLGPDAGPFVNPDTCDAGSTCFAITWKRCTAQQTPPCAVASDCPSTWSCGCAVTCGGVPPPPPGRATVDAACAKTCVPPNSDLSLVACNGPAPPPPENSPTVSPPADVEPDSGPAKPASSSSTGAAGSGGCQFGRDDATTACWSLGVVTAVLGAMRRGSRRRRPPLA